MENTTPDHLINPHEILKSNTKMHKIIIKELAYKYGASPGQIHRILEYSAKQNTGTIEKTLTKEFKESVYKLNEENEIPNNCACCGTSENLTLHHIKPQSKYPHLRYRPENIQILCEKCHKELHENIPIDVPEIIADYNDLFRLRRLNTETNKEEVEKQYKIVLNTKHHKKVITNRQIQKTYTQKKSIKIGEIVTIAFVDEYYNIEKKEKVIVSKCISRKYNNLTYTDAKSEGYDDLESYKEALLKENKHLKKKTMLYMYVFSHIKQGI